MSYKKDSAGEAGRLRPEGSWTPERCCAHCAHWEPDGGSSTICDSHPGNCTEALSPVLRSTAMHCCPLWTEIPPPEQESAAEIEEGFRRLAGWATRDRQRRAVRAALRAVLECLDEGTGDLLPSWLESASRGERCLRRAQELRPAAPGGYDEAKAPPPPASHGGPPGAPGAGRPET